MIGRKKILNKKSERRAERGFRMVSAHEPERRILEFEKFQLITSMQPVGNGASLRSQSRTGPFRAKSTADGMDIYI